MVNVQSCAYPSNFHIITCISLLLPQKQTAPILNSLPRGRMHASSRELQRKVRTAPRVGAAGGRGQRADRARGVLHSIVFSVLPWEGPIFGGRRFCRAPCPMLLPQLCLCRMLCDFGRVSAAFWGQYLSVFKMPRAKAFP